jgi:hypothetical protein
MKTINLISIKVAHSPAPRQKILNLNNIISGENMLSSDAHQQLGAGECATLMESGELVNMLNQSNAWGPGCRYFPLYILRLRSCEGKVLIGSAY